MLKLVFLSYLSVLTYFSSALLLADAVMMNCDEEDVYIKEGQKEETFTVRDANDPAFVRKRFELENEPKHVLNRKGNEIGFGKLKEGVTYILPTFPTFF